MYYYYVLYTILCYLITDVGRMGIWVFRLINVLGQPIDWTHSNRWQTVQQGDAALYIRAPAAAAAARLSPRFSCAARQVCLCRSLVS